MKTNNQSNQPNELMVASLLNAIKELKGELTSSHIDYIELGEKLHNPEECSRCQAIHSAEVMLVLHKHLIK